MCYYGVKCKNCEKGEKLGEKSDMTGYVIRDKMSILILSRSRFV